MLMAETQIIAEPMLLFECASCGAGVEVHAQVGDPFVTGKKALAKAHAATCPLSYRNRPREYPPLGPLERTELIETLREMVEIYQDEVKGGVPMKFRDQPTCIQRAMTILKKIGG
jgi:hypothetical protein